MRELKFRVWLHNSKEWGNVACLEIFNATGKLEYLYQDQPYTIQQYIGLKDKNEKEIYEGDILFFQQQDGVWSNQLNKHIEVKYPFVCGNTHLGEIIGNIFENPELLK